MSDQNVVIVDEAGANHVFPPGFDPQRAAAIVKEQTAPQPSAGTWEDRGIGGKVWHPASGVTERDRVDNSILGVPPELAVLGMGAVGRAVTGPGLNGAGRAVAGMKAAAGQAAPAIKYEVTKSGLEALGVPASVASPIAMIVSSYAKGAKGATAAEAAAPEAAATVPAAAPAARPGISPQQALNEEALAARRAAAGSRAPLKIVPKPSAAAEPVVAESGKMKLTGSEMKEFLRLTQSGISHADALAFVRYARQTGASATEVAKAVAQRTRTGKW